jgi:hypothetical protein
MLDQFRTFNKEGMQLDQLVALAAFGRALKAEFEAQKLDVPEYVHINLKTLQREIAARDADRKAARLTKLKSQRAGLLTTTERRDLLDKEIAELETASQ